MVDRQGGIGTSVGRIRETQVGGFAAQSTEHMSHLIIIITNTVEFATATGHHCDAERTGVRSKAIQCESGIAVHGSYQAERLSGEGACGCLCVRVVCLFFYLREDHLITSTRVIEVSVK